MGGMGFIEHNKGLCMISVLINTHLLLAARELGGVKRFFYASSACVYNGDKQTSKSTDVFLKEEDAYPALPEDGYGWEKLFSERMCRHFPRGLQDRHADRAVPQRVRPVRHVRRRPRKGPAAMCRKVIEAKMTGKHEIEIWGDGQQTRSFMYISDCTIRHRQDHRFRNLLGPDQPRQRRGVTINTLVDIVEDIAGIKLKRSYNLDAPKGVNGRNSDNTLIKKVFGWEPDTKLRDWMEKTYKWIYDQMAPRYKGGAKPALVGAH
jgi:nucleoside-diphosphate-sugar epimerase